MRRSLLGALLMLALLLAAAGCSRYYWSKPGATPQQFARDSQECGQQAGSTLPPGTPGEAVEQYYRACLYSRGYVRATQFDPPPVDSFRGIEDTEQFAALTRSAAVSRQSFEQQLAQLDDLKARGRITPEEYATMRRRLVESATPASLVPAPIAPTPAAPTQAGAAPSTAAPAPLAGRWYGRGGALLDIRQSSATELEWDWEYANTSGIRRASGTGAVSGDKISLVGRQSAGPPAATPVLSFDLTWQGDVLRGVSRGHNNLPVNVEFTRTRP
ncbi:MAG TPA: SHOCT domain-containing protein [Methylomirabilota bacterium]|nr:SHOCT domain-containing protein [Methylomirabilota bacterium]